MKNKIIALVLAIITLFLCTVTVYAEEKEEFLSDIALVYEDSVEEARKKIQDTDWKLYEKNLNAEADYWFDNGVYLIYKTTANVEEAITDLRVMDMYGGYSISDYERQLEESRAKYLQMVGYIRTAATVFSDLYKGGDEMAAIAYRQMNYYKDIGESNLLMGDFLLNIPSDDALVQVMMEGNSRIVSNLVSLLAIGVSGSGDSSLGARIEKLFGQQLSDEEHYESSLLIIKQVDELRAKLLRYDAVCEEFDLNDENMTDEEFLFVTEYASVVASLDATVYGQESLADFIRRGEYTAKDLYPIAAALTKGEWALMELGQFETLIKYSVKDKPIEELVSTLEELEAEMTSEDGVLSPIDVYFGVDRTIFEGSFAMTNAAERTEALSGESWTLDSAKERSEDFYIASIVLASLDAVTLGAIAGFYIKKAMLAHALKAAHASNSLMELIAVTTPGQFALKWGGVVKGLTALAIGLALVAAGLTGISTWYNYYNPNYTEIPSVMIDVRETDLGDSYIKYSAAKVFGEEDKNADFNAYQGKEWIALYYTKDANAGNCLTPNFKYSESDSSVARRHQGVSMFGESKAFNLNSHVYDGDAKPVYLSVRYSNTKKAAANVPDVVGSLIITGALYAVIAIGGAGVGVGSVMLINHRKGKKNAVSDANAEPEVNPEDEA